MTPDETAAILRQFNEWLRTPSFRWREGPSKKEITTAIDAAVEMIESAEEDRAEPLAKGCAAGGLTTLHYNILR